LDESFDITNVDYYDIILETPFLMKWGISLDFSSHGRIKIEGQLIPQGWPVEQAETLNAVSTHAKCASSQ
jgi:hypothetical protein